MEKNQQIIFLFYIEKMKFDSQTLFENVGDSSVFKALRQRMKELEATNRSLMIDLEAKDDVLHRSTIVSSFSKNHQVFFLSFPLLNYRR